MAEGHRFQRVVQERDGVELEGWAEWIGTPRGDHRCKPRIVEQPGRVGGGPPEPRRPAARETSLPPGYLAMPLDAASLGQRLLALARPGTRLFVPVAAPDGVRCAEYAFSELEDIPFWDDRPGKRLGLRRERERGRSETYGVALAGGAKAVEVILKGPVVEGGGERSVGLADATYLVVDLTPEAVVLLPCPWCGPGDAHIAAYHRDDVEAWFFDRGACERQGSILNSSGLLK